MSQAGYTPISLYFSATSAAVPLAANLVAGELALNTNDGKLYYKNSSGVVTLLAGATAGPAGGSTTQVQYNNAGVLAGITGATTNGTALTLVAPVLGTPASGVVTNLTGTASININGTVGATAANSGAFTSGTFSTTLGVTGATTLSSTLGVTGTSTMAAINASGTVAMAGAATVGTTLGVTGATTLSSTLGVSGVITRTATAASNSSGLILTGSTTGNHFIQVNNTTGTFYAGVDSSTGGSFTGLAAYGSLVGSAAGTTMNLASNGIVTLTSNAAGTGITIPGNLNFSTTGNFYAGTATQTPDATHAGQAITTSGQMYNSAGATAADSVLNRFINTNGLVGTIGTLNSGTYYNTSSDMRLKRDLGIATDTSVLRGVQIHDFEWIAGNIIDRGVFAQEAHKVKPSAISVGLDKVDEAGHFIKPWSADYSKFVPDLIVGWQDHEARIAELVAKVAALEAR